MRRYAYLIGLCGLVFAAWMFFLTAQTSGPAINRWTPTADMATARASACSVLLQDGRVMVAGGTSAAGVVPVVELYNSNGTFVPGPSMQHARANASCTLMQDGRVFVAGGNDGTQDLATTEIFDPVAGAWTAGANMSVARSGHGALLTPWGAVMIAGGSSNGHLTDSVEMYSTANYFVTAGSLSSPRKDFAITALDKYRILIAGGTDGTSPVKAVDIFDSRNQTVAPAGAMLAARSQLGAATLLDGTVLLTGGYDPNWNVLATTEIFDAAKGESVAGPDMTTPRAGHQAFALSGNGAVLLVGGTDGSSILSSSEQYPFWAGQFSAAASMNTARSGQASAQMLAGGLVVAGGRNNSGFLAGSEVYGFATMATDKPDYAPGSTVTMTGAGWKPGEMVAIKVTTLPVDQHDIEFSATAQADASGHISVAGFHVDQSHLGMKFLLSATGSQSIAQMTFTDAIPLAFSGITVTPPSPQTAPVNVTLSFTYSPATATGSFTLLLDGTETLQGPVNAAGGSQNFTSIAMPVGTHTLTVIYAGSGLLPSGDASFDRDYTVQGLNTSTSLSVTPPTAQPYGTTLTLSSVVTATGYTPTTGDGTIIIYDVTNPANPVALSGPLPLNTASQASMTINTLSATTHTLQAVFTPTPTSSPYLGSQSTPTLSVTVNPLTPSFSLSLSPSIVAGAPFQVTATSAAAGNGAFPTGSVVLYIDGTAPANAVGVAQPLSGGATTFNVVVPNGLTAGSHSANISYLGDGNFTGTTNSPSQPFVVGMATPVITVTTNPVGSFTYGGSIVYTAQVSAPAADAASGLVPTGTVDFLDTSTCAGTVCPAVLVNGVATMTMNAAYPAGNYSLTAVYVPAIGPQNFNTVTSSPGVPYTIKPAASSITISSSQQTAPLGTVVTYTAVVTLPNGLTAGSVTFTDTTSGNNPLTSGTCTGTLTALTATCAVTYNGSSAVYGSGTHTIQAAYVPPTATAASYVASSASLTEIINAAPTTTALTTISPASTLYGQPVSLSATVASAGNSAALGANDSIQFLDGSTVIGTVGPGGITLGAATTPITVSNLAVGTHSITAKYVPGTGNATYAASSSTAQTVTVGQAVTSLTNPAVTFPLAPPYYFGNPVTVSSTLSVTTTGQSGTFAAPTGTVTLKEGTNVLGVGTIGSTYCAGLVCSFPVPAPVGGNHFYTVVYSGDANYAGFSATDPSGSPIVVTPAGTTTTVTVNPATSALGQSVVLTATVTPTLNSTPPTGTVTFFVNSVGQAPVALSGGVASMPVSSMLVSTNPNTIWATYNADSNYATSTSTPALNYTVNADPTTVTVSSNLSNVSMGTAVSLSAAIGTQYNAPGGLKPNGTINFFDTLSSPNNIGSVTVTAGVIPSLSWTPQAFGSHSITASFTTSDANFASSPVSPAITVAVGATPTATALGALSASYYYGQTISLTATVTSAGTVPLSGNDTIQFLDGNVPIATAAAGALGIASTAVPVSNLAPGPHSITAKYLPGTGNNTYATSTSTPAAVTVNQNPTTITGQNLPISVVFGNPVTIASLIAIVQTQAASGFSAPTGTVTLKEGTNILGVATLGLPQCTGLVCGVNLPAPTGGSHTYTALYSGDTNYGGSSTTIPVSVTAAATSTVVTASPASSSALGQIVTFTATVGPTLISTPPAGTVQFVLDGSTNIGSAVTLSGGTASVSTSTIGLNGHNITAAYTPAVSPAPANYAASTSLQLPYTVNPDPTTVSVTSNLTTVTIGSAVNLTATITPQFAPPAGQKPNGGTVNFFDALTNTNIGSVATNGGSVAFTATLSWTPQINGAHGITAQYSQGGDVNFLGSAVSPAITVFVGANPTTTTLALAPASPYYYGEALTLSATVAPQASGATANPAGTVQFYDGNTVIGSATLAQVGSTNTSAGSITLSNLGTVAHSLTATYVPANSQPTPYAASTSNTLAPAINPAVTALSAVAPSVTTAFGTSLALQTTLSVTAPGDNGSGFSPATGSITFKDGGTPIGTVAVISGPATYTLNISTLSVGTHTITAVYSGDSNYAGSTAASGSQIVGPANTTASVSSVPTGSVYEGQNVTFTVSFGPVLNGTPVASTSSASLVDTVSGGTICSLLNFVGGTTTCMVPALTVKHLGVANHTISVISLSDPNYVLSNVNTEVLNVILAPTQTTLTDLPAGSSQAGQSVTFTATVTLNPLPAAGVTLAPTGSVSFTDNNVNNPLTGCNNVAVNAAGVATCTFTFASGSVASHTITATYSGDANTATSFTSLTHTIGAPIPTIVLTTSNTNATAAYGQQINVTVTLTNPLGAQAPAPAGTVQLFAGLNNQGPSLTLVPSATLGVSSATWNIQTGLAPGSYALTAQFSPSDHNYTAGTSPVLNFIVTAEPVVVSTVNSSAANPVFSQTITLTATVKPSDASSLYGAAPAGSVYFMDGTQVIGGTVTYASAGTTLTATLSNVTSLATGSHSIKAVYTTDGNYSGGSSGSALSLTVSPALTMISAPTITPSTVAYGASFSLSAAVSPVAPAASGTSLFAPTDTIRFYDGSVSAGTLLGSAPVINGTATLTGVTALSGGGLLSPLEGPHNIIAVFVAGDPNYTTSTSLSSQLTIGKVTPVVTVAPSVVAPVFYQSETLTATIAPPAAITGITSLPTGTVTFSNNGNVLGTSTVQQNYGQSTATLTLPGTGVNALPVGTNNIITAAYNGDANFVAASSPSSGAGALNVPVAQAGTTVQLTSSAQAGLATQPITFTAVVTVNPPGGVGSTVTTQPTGNVKFFTTLGSVSTTLGTSPLTTVAGQNSQPNTYQATLTLTPAMLASLNLSVTTMQVFAYYSGDGNYLNNTSSVWTQALNKATTTTAMTASPNPTQVGNAVTITATVTPITASTGIVPTGNVIFYDGSVSLNGLYGLTSQSPLVNGTATFVAPSLAVGVHSITAQYQGDNNFQPSEGSAVAVTINKMADGLTLTASTTSAVASQPLTFTATISPTAPAGVAQPSGQVTLLDGSNVICVASVSAGVATFTFPSPGCSGMLVAGTHNLNAMYPGDGNWTSANSSYVTVIVSPAVTTTTVVSSADPSVYGQAVTFTVNAAVAYPGTTPATGTVQLFDNAVALGNSASINNGTVQITIPVLAVGTHNIIASYVGGASFSASSSPALTQIVNKAPTNTTLAVNPSATSSGSQIVLTAVVAVPSPGSGTPTGSVVFSDATSNATLGTVALTTTGGVLTATLTTNKENQASAPRLLVATYQGDANFASSASQAQPETVNGTSIAVLNGASYFGSNFAPDGAAAIFVTGIVSTTLVAPSLPLPNSLAGVTVTVTDSQGVSRQAGLYFVSPSQINFDMPTNTAIGLATVTVNNSTGGSASGVILVTSTAPGIFTANQNGLGVAQALFVDATPTGAQTITNTATYNGSTGTWVANPLTMVATDTYVVELYGTGLRYAGNGTVTATINGQAVTVLYAGAQPQYPGLDQVNLLLPISLKGTGGPVTIVVTVNGQAANAVTVNIN